MDAETGAETGADDAGDDIENEGDVGEGEGDAEGDEAEEEEEEEEEPKLKYQRLGSSVASILKSDTARTMIAHDKFLVLGTQQGHIHVLDLNGNEIMKLEVHSGPVTDMSMDSTGDFIASCSSDGMRVRMRVRPR